MWEQLRYPHVICATISEEFNVEAFIMWLQKRWDRKCFNSPVMSLWWKRLHQTSSNGNVGFVWAGICISQRMWRNTCFDSVRRQKLLANLSNQNHIVEVNHGMNLRILPRPDLFPFLKRRHVCSLLGDILRKSRNSSWQEAAEMCAHHRKKGKWFTFALWIMKWC